MSPSPAGAPAPATVRVEALSWVNTFVGGTGSGSLEFDVPAEPGDTVRDVLKRFSKGHPRLHEALWDPATGELGSHIEVVVNDAILDITHTLDSPVEPGDRIVLMGQYLGG